MEDPDTSTAAVGGEASSPKVTKDSFGEPDEVSSTATELNQSGEVESISSKFKEYSSASFSSLRVCELL
jgi:hypothetical protein